MRTRSVIRIVLASLALSAAMPALGGPLRPVASDGEIWAFPPILLSGTLTAEQPSDDQAGEVRTIVGKIAVGEPGPDVAGLSISAALAYSKSGLSEPDLLMLDATGTGTFDRTKAISLRTVKPMASEISHQTEFGPATVSVVRQSKTFPVSIWGVQLRLGDSMQSRMGDSYMVQAMCSPAVGGTCEFGKASYPVRMIDQDGDFRFDNLGRWSRENRGIMGTGVGDVLLIDTGDGTFTTSVTRAFYGQPLHVDGRWYGVKVAATGDHMAATPVKIAGGMIHVDADRWELVVLRDGKLLLLAGGRKPVAVPAGDFAILMARRWSAPDAQGRRAWLLALDQSMATEKGPQALITVRPDQTLKLPLGADLAAKLEATVDKTRNVEFSLASVALTPELAVAMVTDHSGSFMSRPAKPKIRVTDAQGKVIYETALEYG